MPTRAEILDTLAASQEHVLAYFGGLSALALELPCTASGVPGEATWRAKDHFAHLAANERNLQVLLRLALTGATSLPGTTGALGREERLALANQRNQSYVDAHRGDAMETLQLLEMFTDAPLAAPVSVSSVADRPAGELFAANAQHADAHMTRVEEGSGVHDGVSRRSRKCS